MDGTPIKLKAKYTCPKTRGKHKGGERPGKDRRKHPKTGAKTYVYGSRVMLMTATGKTRMVEGTPAVKTK